MDKYCLIRPFGGIKNVFSKDKKNYPFFFVVVSIQLFWAFLVWKESSSILIFGLSVQKSFHLPQRKNMKKKRLKKAIGVLHQICIGDWRFTSLQNLCLFLYHKSWLFYFLMFLLSAWTCTAVVRNARVMAYYYSMLNFSFFEADNLLNSWCWHLNRDIFVARNRENVSKTEAGWINNARQKILEVQQRKGWNIEI